MQKRPVTRLTALLIAAALWAGIFLPGLGSPEMKGEEGRRVLPAVTMVEGGNWVVPYVGGEPFLRKPPLVQWCMAGSMKVFGQNIWAARLPSALSVLALAAVIILCTRRWLSAEQSLLAAIIVMSQTAMIQKGRLAEMESIYVALSGIAMVLWMSWWSQRRSAWLVWVVPFLFNGLAILAKAPMHLLFFYALVLAVLAAAGELRRIWNWPHLAGILCMIGIVLAWYLPYQASGLINSSELSHTLQRQALERFTGAEFRLGAWLMNIPDGVDNHLPWVLFAPLLWQSSVTAGWPERTAALIRGGRWAVALCFVVLLLIPGVLPRYLQPLAAPFSAMLAPALWESTARVRRWWRRGLLGLTGVIFIAAAAAPFVVASAITRGAEAVHPVVAGLVPLAVGAGTLLLMWLRPRLRESLHLGLWTGLAACMAMLIYSVCALPWMRLKEDVRPFAKRIDQQIPPGETLVAYSVDFPPLLATLFYLETTPFIYAADADRAPEGEWYYLVRGKDQRKFRDRFDVIGEPVAIWKPDDDEKPSVVIRAARIDR